MDKHASPRDVKPMPRIWRLLFYNLDNERDPGGKTRAKRVVVIIEHGEPVEDGTGELKRASHWPGPAAQHPGSRDGLSA